MNLRCRLTKLALLAPVAVLALSCGERPPGDPAPGASDVGTGGPIFVDRAAELDLDFVHFNGMTGEYYMAEVTGAGGALLDADNDGDLDVYLVQGALIGDAAMSEALFPPRHPLPLTDRLYLNELDPSSGELHFVDVTASAGLDASDYGMGVTTGDVNNDGRIDLYVTSWGPNRLLLNQGIGPDGRVGFRDVAAAAGCDDQRWSVPVTFFDADADGWLDLFVGNYIAATVEDRPICYDSIGAQDYCGPGAYAPLPDRLFLNRGDETKEDSPRFADGSALLGNGPTVGPALGVVVADFDSDGRPDLYVANDAQPNHLWLQQEDGSFRDQSLLAGTSVNAAGKAESSMGVDAADFDGDGDFDLFMTHLTGQTNTFFENNGNGLFDDRTVETGLGLPSQTYTSFGTSAFDYDNDGLLDIFVGSGEVKKIDALARAGDSFPLHQPNQLFRNLGRGTSGRLRFEEVTARAGRVFEYSEVSRGAAFGDIDNDGDTDVLLANNNGQARLLFNQVGSRNHWIGLRVTVESPPRDAIGAVVTVTRDDGLVLVRRIRTDGSFASASDPRVVVGLADRAGSVSVVVRWPGGVEERWESLEVDRYHHLHRGDSQQERSDRE